MTLSSGKSTARGELLFFDSFQYPVGPLAGQGPPIGAPPGQTGWSAVTGNPKVTARGLDFPRVFSTGGGTSFQGNSLDHVVAYLTPVANGVVWLGFLINLRSGGDFGFAVVNLGNDAVTAPGYGVLYNSGLFGIDNGTHGHVSYSTISPGPMPSWLVVKLDFDAGMQTLYVNPAFGTNSPERLVPNARIAMDADFQAAGFDRVYLNVGLNDGIWGFDEVRIGTTFADVRSGE
jgi:hypothetical protein